MEKGRTTVKELFVVGNGLDLQCGLGTTYYNFLKYVLQSYKEQLNIGETECALDEVATRLEGSLSYVDSMWRGNYVGDVYRNLNIWYQIFLHEKMINNQNWSSVEEVIAKYLKEYNMIQGIVSTIRKNKVRFIYRGGYTPSKESVSVETNIISKVAYSLVNKDVETLNLSEKELYQNLNRMYHSRNNLNKKNLQDLLRMYCYMNLMN